MRAAAYAFAITVMLALTGLPARCHQANTENEAEPLCKGSPRDVIVRYRRGWNWSKLFNSHMDKGLNKVSVVYGTEIGVMCGGTSPKHLFITRNDVKLITNQPSYGYINYWVTNKLDLPLQQNVFTCIDSKTTCELSVIILVTPSLEVMSSTIGNCPRRNHTYSLQYGNTVSVLCSGPEAARLVMSKDGKTISTIRKNDTTIESFERTPDLQISEYVCAYVDTTYNGSVIVKVVPKIYFQSITPYHMDPDCDNEVQHYYFEYTNAIEVFCSGPRAVKFIHREYDSTNSLTENFTGSVVLGKNTVFLNITKLGKSEFTCSDNEFSDYAQRVIVIVAPRMEVSSPSARESVDYNLRKYFTIPYGEPLEIVCSGPDSSRLSIRENRLRDITITNSVEQTVNKSAVKFTVKEPAWVGCKGFFCEEVDKSDDMVAMYVEVGVLPAAKDFRCLSYNQQYIHCTWTAINDEILYTLFHDRNGTLHTICERQSQYNKKHLYCLWEYMIDYSNDVRGTFVRDFTFKMQSKDIIGTTNQTFQFDHLTILKLAPPEKLEVAKKTSRGAVLKWKCGFTEPFTCVDYQYKVQYWHPGIGSQDGNSALVTCDLECNIDLILRCPGQFYEVGVYQKLKTAIGEEFWSDPSYVSLKTDEENDNTNNIDPKCSQEPVKTKEVMKYFVQKLRKEMRPEIQPMKQKVRELYDKLANVRKYMASTK